MKVECSYEENKAYRPIRLSLTFELAEEVVALHRLLANLGRSDVAKGMGRHFDDDRVELADRLQYQMWDQIDDAIEDQGGRVLELLNTARAEEGK